MDRLSRVGVSGLLAAAFLLLPNPSARAGDWPQILGPHRNGIAEDETLLSAWPATGPKTVWQRDVGSGFAGIAVADGTAVLFHRVGAREVAEAMESHSGDILWKVDFPTNYAPQFVPDNGPRCVPLIHAGRVYLFGAQGGLRCVDLKTGRTIWQRETHQDFNAQEGYFGAGSSPIIEGDRLVVNVGGARSGAGIVAFSLDNGETLWKATDEQASYSSPVAATIDGTRHLIFVTRLKVVSLNPQTGAVRFEFPFGKRGPTVNAATPLVLGQQLFVSASYGVGATLARINSTGADILWRDDHLMSSQYATCIAHDGYLYGIDGRQDVGIARLRCFDPQTKTIQWTEESYGYATLIKADGKLLIIKTDGELVLADPNPRRYTELAKARLVQGPTRALPALSNGRLFVRDEDTLKCLQVGKSSPVQ